MAESNEFRKNNSDWKICDLCNSGCIHKNDMENHLTGRRHKYTVRAKEKMEKKDDNIQHNYRCLQCKTKFTNEEFYKVHIGSKTHRRNVRRLGPTKVTDSIIATMRLISPFSPTKKGRSIPIAAVHKERDLDSDFVRKKYRTRFIKTDELYYRSYINTVTAYLSLRLAFDPNVKDFMISINEKKWGAFGDIIIDVFYKEKNILYAIQCKQVSQTYKQIDTLQDGKLFIEKEYAKIADLKKTIHEFGETKFVLFTTSGTTSSFFRTAELTPNVLNNWKTCKDDIVDNATVELRFLRKKNHLINVSGEEENVYSFQLVDKVECQLPNVFLYTNQRVFPAMLNQILKLKFDTYPDIAKDFIKYIENWGEGKLGGNYRLRKSDIILKVGEILLKPFVVFPKKVHSKQDSFEIWNSVINNVDLTVVQIEPFIISKICQPLNKIVENTFSATIDSVSKSINKSKIVEVITSPMIKAYLFEIGQDRLDDDIPLHLLYNVLWKAGRIPLLLCTENMEESKGFIMDVIFFMKQMGVHKKFLLKTADMNLNRFKGNLQIFTCLEDIKDLVNLNEIKIRVTDSFSLSLEEIRYSDSFFSKWVTPNIFFDMALGKYSFKANYHTKRNKDLEVLTIILSEELKEQLENSIYKQVGLSRANSGKSNVERLRGIDPCLF